MTSLLMPQVFILVAAQSSESETGVAGAAKDDHSLEEKYMALMEKQQFGKLVSFGLLSLTCFIIFCCIFIDVR